MFDDKMLDIVAKRLTINYQRLTSQMSRPSLLDVCHGEDVALCVAKNYKKVSAKLVCRDFFVYLQTKIMQIRQKSI